jgi:hypothetical protein
MSQKSNKKSVKSSTTGNNVRKLSNSNNKSKLTEKNLNVFNFGNDTTSESYNTSNSSDLNDGESDDDAETVITDYASNPHGLTTPPPPNDEMDVDDYEPPATELKTYEGKDMFYIINGKMEPVTNATYTRYTTIYDIDGNIIPKEHLPENRLFINNDIMDEDVKIGGKRQRKTHRKTKRNTMRKTKRKTRKTRRHKRRHTKKYK